MPRDASSPSGKRPNDSTASTHKKRRTIQFDRLPAGLQDCDDEVEQEKLREDEITRRGVSTPRRASMGKPGNSRYIAIASVPGASLAQAKPLSADELENLHRSCMEMSSANRINAQNSWNLKLIDYLQEVMTSNLSQSSNFQVASVTIECSVKIYSSRVDSLESESLRVVSSLNRTDGKQPQQPQGDVPEAGAAKEAPTRRTHHASTLEANPDALDVKNVEAQFDVDPLFRVTCSKFDAGGAAGLLLNNVRTGPQGQLLLDSSVVAHGEDVGDDDLWGAADGGGAQDDDMDDAPLLPTEAAESGEASGPGTSFAASDPCSPALKTEALPLDDNDAMGLWNDDDDGPGDHDFDDPDQEQPTPPLTAAPRDTTATLPALLPAPDVEAKAVAQSAQEIEGLLDAAGDDFSFFNRDKMANAGKKATPEQDEGEASDCDSEIERMAPVQSSAWSGLTVHWKFRLSKEPANDAANAPQKEERKRRGRETQRIDFGAELKAAERRALEPPADPYSALSKSGKERAKAMEGKLSRERAQRILLLMARGTDPKAMLIRAKRKGLYLPDDAHFDVDSLFQPFTRAGAEWNLKLRALHKRQQEQCGGVIGEGEAPPAVIPAALGDPLPDLEADLDRDDYEGAEALDFDGDADDESLDMNAPEPLPEGPAGPPDAPDVFQELPLGDAVDLVQMPEQAKPLNVNYCKVAKQVDIRRLKECMWARITAAFAPDPTCDRPPRESLHLTELIAHMAPDVAQLGDPREITISFYFISLLHVANERGLTLQGQGDLLDLSILRPSA